MSWEWGKKKIYSDIPTMLQYAASNPCQRCLHPLPFSNTKAQVAHLQGWCDLERLLQTHPSTWQPNSESPQQKVLTQQGLTWQYMEEAPDNAPGRPVSNWPSMRNWKRAEESVWWKGKERHGKVSIKEQWFINCGWLSSKSPEEMSRLQFWSASSLSHQSLWIPTLHYFPISHISITWQASMNLDLVFVSSDASAGFLHQDTLPMDYVSHQIVVNCQGHSTQCSQRDKCLFCGQTSPTSHCQ